MKPHPRYVSMPKQFWACVKTISQEAGYTNRGLGSVKVPSVSEIGEVFATLGLPTSQIIGSQGQTDLAKNLGQYFQYRAQVLNDFVEPRLMNKQTIPAEYAKISSARPHNCPQPMNKQKGEKKQLAYLTCIINMLVEEGIEDLPCDFDPRTLTIVTKAGSLVRTLSRRVDGAFPSAVDPIAIWEVKEYYHTTTFGSRVADGVYETLLDGMELEELREKEGIRLKHYLMLDDHYTWWDCGRSYLCRIIDMLHMGYVDEVLFGREVIERLSDIAREWAADYRQRSMRARS